MIISKIEIEQHSIVFSIDVLLFINSNTYQGSDMFNNNVVYCMIKYELIQFLNTYESEIILFSNNYQPEILQF